MVVNPQTILQCDRALYEVQHKTHHIKRGLIGIFLSFHIDAYIYIYTHRERK